MRYADSGSNTKKLTKVTVFLLKIYNYIYIHIVRTKRKKRMKRRSRRSRRRSTRSRWIMGRRRGRRRRWRRRRWRRITIIITPESLKECRLWHKHSKNPKEPKNPFVI